MGLEGNRLFHSLHYVSLCLPMAFMIGQPDVSPDRWLLAAVGTVLLSGLYAVVRVAGRRRWQPAYLAALVLVAVLLFAVYPSYLLLPFTAFPLLCVVPNRRWAIGGVAALLVGLLAVQSVVYGLTLELGDALSTTSPIFLALFVGLAVGEGERRGEERRRLADEVAAAQAERADAAHLLGRAEERERLAREMHDTLAQGLGSIVMQMEAAEQLLGRNEAQLAERLRQARQVARSSLAEFRRAVHELYPEDLDGATLPDAVERLCARHRTSSGVAVRFRVDGDRAPLAPGLEVTALRVAQEALSNVVKHAGARNVDLVVAYDTDVLRLTIRDDGQGFDPSAASAGFGLRAMRHRVAVTGGSLRIEGRPGVGTTLTAVLPAEEMSCPLTHPA